ncbi:hypothetical protein C8E87_6978 [Paractinoplanes brasiliensis]|uniref:Uncharacterized protein n=1 Tax=Paractinoplanes brasiliensis TaxID=52695 RepID=A0A4R6J7X6_9ACTN|nr:hypothetical protein C8E87_6978 [Actinoplanes brasiliensis]
MVGTTPGFSLTHSLATSIGTSGTRRSPAGVTYGVCRGNAPPRGGMDHKKRASQATSMIGRLTANGFKALTVAQAKSRASRAIEDHGSNRMYRRARRALRGSNGSLCIGRRMARQRLIGTSTQSTSIPPVVTASAGIRTLEIKRAGTTRSTRLMTTSPSIHGGMQSLNQCQDTTHPPSGRRHDELRQPLCRGRGSRLRGARGPGTNDGPPGANCAPTRRGAPRRNASYASRPSRVRRFMGHVRSRPHLPAYQANPDAAALGDPPLCSRISPAAAGGAIAGPPEKIACRRTRSRTSRTREAIRCGG